jgi:hypothetical protein
LQVVFWTFCLADEVGRRSCQWKETLSSVRRTSSLLGSLGSTLAARLIRNETNIILASNSKRRRGEGAAIN